MLKPKEVYIQVHKRYWENKANWKKLLLGEKSFPIRISLKPPAGKQIFNDLKGYQEFISEWQSSSFQKLVKWEKKTPNAIETQLMPVALVINNVGELIDYLDKTQITTHWEKLIECIVSYSDLLYKPLILNIEKVEKLSLDDAELIIKTLEQLKPNIGKGLYLRAIPLIGVDTKFLESNATIISILLDALTENSVSNSGNLSNWLGCNSAPNGWIYIRPLCEATEKKLGFPILQLPSNRIQATPLPANNIIVVENVQSGLALPKLKNTIAVFGGGKNVSWLRGDWLKGKNVAYWGDIDSWGLVILDDAKRHLPTLQALMMDKSTLEAHKSRSVREQSSNNQVTTNLTSSEQEFLSELLSYANGESNRLEQERLSQDYIVYSLNEWLYGKNDSLHY